MKNYYESKIKHIELDKKSKRVDFDVYDEFWETTTHYHTNENGEGLWMGYDYIHQIVGTWDFRLRQETISGMRKALRKYFN